MGKKISLLRQNEVTEWNWRIAAESAFNGIRSDEGKTIRSEALNGDFFCGELLLNTGNARDDMQGNANLHPRHDGNGRGKWNVRTRNNGVPYAWGKKLLPIIQTAVKLQKKKHHISKSNTLQDWLHKLRTTQWLCSHSSTSWPPKFYIPELVVVKLTTWVQNSTLHGPSFH